MDQNGLRNYSLYCEEYYKRKINRNIVFIESHNGIDFAGNMIAIARELSENREIFKKDICLVYVAESKQKLEELIERYDIQHIELVLRESDRYFEILATAGYLYTDVAFYPLYRKKKGQICVSTWHGTPLKTLGYTYCEDAYVVANQKRGFLLADYFVCPNMYTWECIRKSYQLDGLFKGKVIFGGYPRNTIFYNEDRREVLKKELGLEGKHISVYMPTWRGKVIQVNQEQSVELQKMLDEIDKKLPEDCVILAKLHRLNRNKLDFSEFKHIEIFPEEYDTYDVLNLADTLITDYSSVMFDFEIMEKKIILFCYDKEDYVENRGCYFDVEKLPFPIVTETGALVREILTEKNYDDTEIRKEFNKYDCAESTNNICRDIILNEKNCYCFETEKNDKKKAFVFVGELNENECTDALFFYLDNFKEYDCYISYMNHLFKEKWYRLLQFPGMNLIPMYMYQGRYSYYTEEETKIIKNIKNSIASGKKIEKNEWLVQENIGTREFERYLYQNKFDIFVRYAGLDLESLKWFRIYRGFKILIIHDNMIDKAETNKEYNVYLQRAMEVANEIRYANKKVFEKSEKIFLNVRGKKIIDEMY